MKLYKIFKYWWWYNITVSKNRNHKIMDYRSYLCKGWWVLDSKRTANKMKCKFRLCEKIFTKEWKRMSYEKDQKALQRGASDFTAGRKATDNPYSTNDNSYYLWKEGFRKAKEEPTK